MDTRAFRLCIAMCAVAVHVAAPMSPVHADELPADPAWQLYDRAFARLAEADRAGARALLAEVQATYPEHPAAAEAGRRLAAMDASAAGGTAEQPVDSVGDRRRSKLARGELVFSMTGHGILAGSLVCGMLDCSSERAVAALLMLGGGGGLGASLYLTRDGITPGQAQLYSSAVTWGLLNSLMFNDGVADEPSKYGVHVASQAGGLLMGVGLDRLWAPTSGEVAMANSTGFWVTALTLMVHGMVDKAPTWSTLVLAGDAGLVLGGVIGGELPGISRGRLLLIDVGGILGFLSGGLIAVTADADDESALFSPMLVGTLAGLGLSAYWTRHWDVPAPGGGTRLALTPMGTRGWGAMMSFDWP